MSKTKEKPIAILTVNEDISKMKPKERKRLFNWMYKMACEIELNPEDYGKFRARLWKVGK